MKPHYKLVCPYMLSCSHQEPSCDKSVQSKPRQRGSPTQSQPLRTNVLGVSGFPTIHTWESRVRQIINIYESFMYESCIYDLMCFQ